ncbi:MAG TPA: sigma-54 dependent transcriptional regulator [bacterium]|nr:sigma-54 dependent transcriptional regulator [bacterium]HXK92195.1 sigma-54 dependent transcriptional regulator [bacterium]
MKRVLVVTRDEEARHVLLDFFRTESKVDIVESKERCFEKFRKKRYELIFIDLPLLHVGQNDHSNLSEYKHELQPFWQFFPSAELIVLTPPELIRQAIKAVKAGAGNYLTFPLHPDEVKYVTESLYESIRVQYELDYFRDSFWQTDSRDLIRTHSPLMKEVFQKVKAVAPTKTTVLLLGETGTGKGVIARLLHRHSQRGQNQFITVHCGAIPENLLESELFGHEKGSFTGAFRRKLGKFEIAHNGTIFLDEIGTITPPAQIKLLQILQDHTFQRVGGEETLEADVRVIAATNIDLKFLTTQGVFRNDLFYRLNVFPIELPPLRERLEDIPLLVDNILTRLNKFHLKDIHGVHPEVMEAFQRYAWPGNIRELENILERAFILETTSILMPERFPVEIFAEAHPMPVIKNHTSYPLAEARRLFVDRFERQYLSDLLALHGGKINRSAAAAGITVRQLHKLLTKYNIRKEDYK